MEYLPGSSAGAVLTAIISNQFIRLRDGDRFFYTNDDLLWSPEVQAIVNLSEMSLAEIIRKNTLIFNIQDKVFFDDSVLLYKAPEGGANVSLMAGPNGVTLVDNDSGELLALRATNNVSQVILVGSAVASDVFNLFIARAEGGLQNGVTVYGGGSDADRLNVYGRVLQGDTFAVSGAVDSNNTTSANDPDIVNERSVDTRTIDVNGNMIFGTGFETLRLVTLGGADTIDDPDLLALVTTWWDPNTED